MRIRRRVVSVRLKVDLFLAASSLFVFQWLATIANSTLFLGVGMMAAVPTVVIGELHKSEHGLSLDDDQASWFGE